MREGDLRFRWLLGVGRFGCGGRHRDIRGSFGGRTDRRAGEFRSPAPRPGAGERTAKAPSVGLGRCEPTAVREALGPGRPKSHGLVTATAMKISTMMMTIAAGSGPRRRFPIRSTDGKSEIDPFIGPS